MNDAGLACAQPVCITGLFRGLIIIDMSMKLIRCLGQQLDCRTHCRDLSFSTADKNGLPSDNDDRNFFAVSLGILAHKIKLLLRINFFDKNKINNVLGYLVET